MKTQSSTSLKTIYYFVLLIIIILLLWEWTHLSNATSEVCNDMRMLQNLIETSWLVSKLATVCCFVGVESLPKFFFTCRFWNLMRRDTFNKKVREGIFCGGFFGEDCHWKLCKARDSNHQQPLVLTIKFSILMQKSQENLHVLWPQSASKVLAKYSM